MNVVFRADASIAMGAGHVMRCLSLADALSARGASVRFICRAHVGHFGDEISRRGYAVDLLPVDRLPEARRAPDTAPPLAHADWLGSDAVTDAAQTLAVLKGAVVDWLIVDQYALDACWEQQLRQATGASVLVIDDLADRAHACDVLLDQNLGRHARDYSGLVADACTLLIGPAYALLRLQFAEWRELSLARRAQPQLGRILVAMGGSDPRNATSEVLDALRHCVLPHELRISVVMGAHAPYLREVRACAGELRNAAEVQVDVHDMARLMAASDLAIGAAGTSAWERCCMGLPTLLRVLANNQRAGAQALAKAGAAIVLREGAGFAGDLRAALAKCQEPSMLSAMQNACAAMVDGGGAHRVVEALFGRRR